MEDLPEETRNFLLEWLKGRPGEVSTHVNYVCRACPGSRLIGPVVVDIKDKFVWIWELMLEQ